MIASGRPQTPSLVPGRILHVIWSLTIGGAERALYQLVLAQRDDGADVGVLVASDPGLYGKRLAEQGITVESLGQDRGLDVSAALAARSVFARWPIVHFHAAEPPLMLAAATSDARTYYTHRAGTFQYPLRRQLRYRAAGAVMRRSFNGMVGNTHHAAGVAAELFHVPRARVGVVYNGIDWDFLRPARSRRSVASELGLSPADIVVGTSANLRRWKRIDMLIRALPRASDRVVCVVVGDGPERRGLEMLANEQGVAARVRFVGLTANVADYLQLMDVFVMPSGQQETFGNSTVEAMGLGIPTIICCDGGGQTEHVAHGQTGVIVRGIGEIAAWIDRLAGDSALRRSIGARGQDAVRSKYTIERMVRGYADLYADWPDPRPRSVRRAPLPRTFDIVQPVDAR